MSIAQAAFALGLTVAIVLVVCFGWLVLRTASRQVGDPVMSTEAVRRLARPRTQRLEAGRWAFYAHRIGGVAIFAFLVLHLGDVALYAVSTSLYNNVHELYGSTPLRIFECALLLAILFHTFNGLRLLAIDLADVGSEVAYRLLLGVVVLTLVVWAGASVIILRPAFG